MDWIHGICVGCISLGLLVGGWLCFTGKERRNEHIG